MNTLALQIRCLRTFMRLVYKGQHALEAIRRRTLKRLHQAEWADRPVTPRRPRRSEAI